MMTCATLRLPMWEGNLAALVMERLRTPFAWGRNDCVTFAADAVQAMTGIDPIASIRGTWHDEVSARRALGHFCGATDTVQAMTIMAQRMAWPVVSSLLARRGDIVVIGGRLAVLIGNGAATPGNQGLVVEQPEPGALAWSI